MLKPVGYTPGKKYPAIFDIHGGPKTAYGTPFFHEMQVWASKGYFVFFCNPKGSDGKGSAFTDIRGQWAGGLSQPDEFLRQSAQTYKDIDSKRLRYRRLVRRFHDQLIIGQTQRFAAACAQRSISNWISKYATTDIGYYFAQTSWLPIPGAICKRCGTRAPAICR